jgi:hypothetical protein
LGLRQENAAITAIRALVNQPLTGRYHQKWQFFAIFLQFRPYSYVKCVYFNTVKKRHLHAAAHDHRKEFPGANPRFGQERKEAWGARLGSHATEKLCLLQGGLKRGDADQCKGEG